MNNFLKNTASITIVVLTNIVLTLSILYFIPELYFTYEPSGQWWTALSIVAGICFGVIAVITVLLYRENKSMKRVEQIEEQIDSIDSRSINTLDVVSNITEIQNVYDNRDENLWIEIISNIKKIGKLDIIKPDTYRVWSNIAWKHDYFDVATQLREIAFEFGSSNFHNRVYLASILIHQIEFKESERVLNLLENTDIKSDNIDSEKMNHYYNVMGRYYWRIKNYEKAIEYYEKALDIEKWSWTYKALFLCMISKGSTNQEIKERLALIKTDSIWYTDKLQSQEVFRLFLDAYLDKRKVNKFYNYFNPLTIAEIKSKYNNEVNKLKLYDFYESNESIFTNDETKKFLYLTLYLFLGVRDFKADSELKEQSVLNVIYKKLRF